MRVIDLKREMDQAAAFGIAILIRLRWFLTVEHALQFYTVSALGT